MVVIFLLLSQQGRAAPNPPNAPVVLTTPVSCADLPNAGQPGGMDLWPRVIETRDPAVVGDPREIWYAIADGMPVDFAEDIRTAAIRMVQ